MMKATTGDFTLSFGVVGILLAAAMMLVLKDLFRQMVEAKVAEELAWRTKLLQATPQPALEQFA